MKVRAPGGAEGLTVGCEGIKGCQGDSRMSGLSHWMTERLLSDSGESRWCGGDGGERRLGALGFRDVLFQAIYSIRGETVTGQTPSLPLREPASQ